ncbi:MAG TPA: hypothetical protein VH593_01125 [Ktedonobacteraceae bacterium]|jgi:hypothetical protein
MPSREESFHFRRLLAHHYCSALLSLCYHDEAANDYYYVIGDMCLEVPSASAHHALVGDLRYRVYYYQLPKKNVLLSVEPLEAPVR